MPSTGTPSSNTAFGARNSCSSYVDAWLPDRMTAFGAKSRTNASLTSFGWISQKTCASRTRRAMSWVTCEPKSRMRILSCMRGSGGRIGRCASSAGAPLAAEMDDRQQQGSTLEHGAEVERRAEPPVARIQVRDHAEHGRAQQRRDHRHQAVQRADRTHGLALRRGAGGAGNDALDRRCGREAEDVGDDDRVHHPALGREAPAGIRKARRDQASDGEALRAEALEQLAEQVALDEHRDDADGEQRQAALARPPAEAEVAVEHPHAVE